MCFFCMEESFCMIWLFITLLSSTWRLAFTFLRVNLRKIFSRIFFGSFRCICLAGQRLIFFGSCSAFSCCRALFSFIIVVCWAQWAHPPTMMVMVMVMMVMVVIMIIVVCWAQWAHPPTLPAHYITYWQQIVISPRCNCILLVLW